MKPTIILITLVGLFACATTGLAQPISQIKQMIEQGQYKQAAQKLRPMADGGNVEAQYLAATLFFEGHGVQKNETQGIKYATMAADKGYFDAIVLLFHHTTETKRTALIGKYSQKEPDLFFNWISQTGCEDVSLLDAVISNYVLNTSGMPKCDEIIPSDANYKQKKRSNQQKLLQWQKNLIETPLWKKIMNDGVYGNNSMKYVSGRIADEVYKMGIEKGPVYCHLIAFKAQTHRSKKNGNKVFDDFTAYTENYYRAGRIENNNLSSWIYRDFNKSVTPSGKIHLVCAEDVVLASSQKDEYKNNKNQKHRYTAFTYPTKDEIVDVVKVFVGAGFKTSTMTFWGDGNKVYEFDNYGNFVREYFENNQSKMHNCIVVQYINIK